MKKIQVGQTVKVSVIFEVNKIEMGENDIVFVSGIAPIRIPYDQGYDTVHVNIKDLPLSQDLTGEHPITL